ncbi:cupin domain-containing protein [Paenibacillaceae bacterium]|nr:cupin domain-containing protein [Paenibacillaceae bacterium]
MTLYLDYTSPTTQFTYDLSNNLLFRKDAHNYINELSYKQVNTLQNLSLLDIFLSTGNVVEPHYHQNASELVYCISGSAVVSLINPFTNELLHFPIQPGQVVNIPQGWWHYEIASVDNTHLLAIFDAPIPETILGSDILRLTPPNVLAHTYCLNEAKVVDTLAPLTNTVLIGPPSNCHNKSTGGAQAAHHHTHHPRHIQQAQPGHPAQQPSPSYQQNSPDIPHNPHYPQQQYYVPQYPTYHY